MKQQYLFQQALQFWAFSQKQTISSKQELMYKLLDPKLLTNFTAQTLEDENKLTIQKSILEAFIYFNQIQVSPSKKLQRPNMDVFLLDKIKSQLSILNYNQIQITFPEEIHSIQRIGELPVYGLLIQRDQNKYFNDYDYDVKEHSLVFEEKLRPDYKKEDTKQDQMRNALAEQIQELPFLNRQLRNIFSLFGKKYEPIKEKDFTQNFSSNYQQFKNSIYGQKSDFILIEDYIVNCPPLKFSNEDQQQNNYSFTLRTERLKFGKEAKSIKLFSQFKLTDIDFICGGNPPAYLKSFL